MMKNGFFDEIGGPDLEEFMEFMFVTGQLESKENDSDDGFDEEYYDNNDGGWDSE